jgi:photosystem II stability/assembly factor-like uncharacterized protein
LLFSFQSFAQVSWQELLPPKVNPYSLAVSSKGNVYADYEGSLSRSTDHGQSWETIVPGTIYSAFGTSPTVAIYLFTDSLRKSTDEGNTWITLNIPAAPYSFLFEPNPIITNDAGNIFVQIDNYPHKDTYRSTDEGKSWVEVGIDSSAMTDIIFKDNFCLARFGKSGYGYLSKSSNNGDDWEVISTAPNNLYTLFAAQNGDIYAGRMFHFGNPPRALFKSTNDGLSWDPVDEFGFLWVADIDENQFGHIFVAAGYGVYRSTDDGDSWHHFNSGLNHTPSYQLAVDSLGYVYVGTGIYGRLYGRIQSTIPVELVSFSAKQIDNNVHLKWQTATELNNHGFEIERKTENSEWRIIGFKEGNGTTTESHYYTFIDDNISSGKYHYRLKQIDYDGKFEYSNIVEVEFLFVNHFSLQQNYPNPFNPSTEIVFELSKKVLLHYQFTMPLAT